MGLCGGVVLSSPGEFIPTAEYRFTNNVHFEELVPKDLRSQSSAFGFNLKGPKIPYTYDLSHNGRCWRLFREAETERKFFVSEMPPAKTKSIAQPTYKLEYQTHDLIV